jgi:RNase P/RNase MRP subunit p29
MKKSYYFLIIIMTTILFSCLNENNINPYEELKSLSNIKIQTIDLDTLKNKTIVGIKGTEIEFERNKFEVENGEKVTLILKEFYEFKELFFNNINTITANNELLESSGVIYISFESNGKKLKLKEKELIKISFPNSELNKNTLFSAKTDSLNQFEWTELKETKAITENARILRNVGGGITIEEIVIDTVGYNLGEFNKIDSLNNSVFLRKFDWINIDKLTEVDENISFQVEIENNDFGILTSYVIYENRNSFVSNYHSNEELKLSNIPIIKSQTFLIVLGYKNNLFFASKTKLENENKIVMKLKEINRKELEKLIK